MPDIFDAPDVLDAELQAVTPSPTRLSGDDATQLYHQMEALRLLVEPLLRHDPSERQTLPQLLDGAAIRAHRLFTMLQDIIYSDAYSPR